MNGATGTGIARSDLNIRFHVEGGTILFQWLLSVQVSDNARCPFAWQGSSSDVGGAFTAKSEYTRAQYEASAANKEDFFRRKQAVSVQCEV